MPENNTHKDVKQLITWGLLLLCCLLLAGILINLLFNNQNGRYAFHAENDTGMFYILDTKTGHVWWRRRELMIVDCGTIEKPTFIINKRDVWDEVEDEMQKEQRAKSSR